MGNREVEFGKYCKVFELMGEDPATKKPWANTICKEICPDWSTEDTKSCSDVYLYQGDIGDGVIVAVRRDKLGTPVALIDAFPPMGSRFATKADTYNESDIGAADRPEAGMSAIREHWAYFIAGAFGIMELPEDIRKNPNPLKVKGLQKIYEDQSNFGTDELFNSANPFMRDGGENNSAKNAKRRNPFDTSDVKDF